MPQILYKIISSEGAPQPRSSSSNEHVPILSRTFFTTVSNVSFIYSVSVMVTGIKLYKNVQKDNVGY